MDAGRILNPLAGSNQIQGAVVMGIGMALFEETFYELQNGAPDQQQPRRLYGDCECRRPAHRRHVLDYPDMKINELGARGIGEIGLAGVAAAIASSVHHTTGVRVRELPVKIEDCWCESALRRATGPWSILVMLAAVAMACAGACDIEEEGTNENKMAIGNYLDTFLCSGHSRANKL
jgi:hypothetical protein